MISVMISGSYEPGDLVQDTNHHPGSKYDKINVRKTFKKNG